MLMAGCRDNDPKGNVDDDGIVLDAQVGAMAKYTGATAFEQGDMISLFATKRDVALAASGNHIDNSLYQRGEFYFTKSSGKDAFPASGGIDIYSFFPYDADAGTKGFPLYSFDCEVDQSIDMLKNDFLIAKTTVEPTLHPVKLQFSHAMSKLIFSAVTASDFTDGTQVDGIKFKLNNKTSVNMSTQLTTVTIDVVEITPNVTKDGNKMIATAIVAPQDLGANDAFAEISLSNGKKINFALGKALNLAQNKYATVDVEVTFGGGKVIVLGAEVTDWGSVDAGSNITVVERLRNGFTGTCTEATMADYKKAEISVKVTGEEKITTFVVDAKSDVTAKSIYFEFRGANKVPTMFPYEIVNIVLVDEGTKKTLTVTGAKGIADQTNKTFSFDATTATF